MQFRWVCTRVWRSARYVLGAFIVALFTMLVPLLIIGALLLIPVAGIGLVLLPSALVGVRRWADLQRHSAGEALGAAIQSPYRPLAPGIVARFRQILTDRVTWRDLGWMFMNILTAFPLGVLMLLLIGNAVLGIITTTLWWVFPLEDRPQVLDIPVTNWARALTLGPAMTLATGGLTVILLPVLAHWHARLSRAMLSPSGADLLTARVEVLTRTRAGMVDAVASELRRIERNLHDGTQARLVTVAMRLGMARETLAENPETAAELIRVAQEDAEEAMVELRDVIRTTYPPILADQGLAGAVTALTARSQIPVKLDVSDLGALPAPIEAAAYFAIAESLTNVAKHSHATHVTVRIARHTDRLTLEVTDDGIGGVDESAGTGIEGIRHRVAALDGDLRLISPKGGPTAIVVELPCAS